MNDIEHELATLPSEEPEPGGVLRIILAELALVVLIAVGVTALIRGASAADPNDALAAAAPMSMSLAAVPSATAEVYQYAAVHAGHFKTLPCYCGCERSLGHRNLEDCFVNPAGGWDPHASGCGICTAEAITARENLDTNVPIDVVRQTIVDRYGPPPDA
jgi:hypothetical protein